MKRYKITLPTPERCKELGVNPENLAIRTQMWLMGVCHGVAFTNTANLRPTDDIRLNFFLANKQAFFVETNSQRMIEQVSNHVSQYGCTVTPVAPPISNCPSCGGERERSSTGPGIYKCYFCGLVTT